MKKIMMIAAMMVAAVSANAQAYVGGGIGFQTTSQGDNTNTVIKIMPEIGYNLSENWAVGIALGSLTLVTLSLSSRRLTSSLTVV